MTASLCRNRRRTRARKDAWLAHSQRDYGRMLLVRDELGDRERAQDLLDQARTTYRELGIEAYENSQRQSGPSRVRKSPAATQLS
jgi:hypothetical protein